MSENKNIPEIIWIKEMEKQDFSKGCYPFVCDRWPHHITGSFKGSNTEYILKSKYDELLKEKEELEKKLSEVNKVNFNKPCYCKNQSMTGGLICHGNCRYI